MSTGQTPRLTALQQAQGQTELSTDGKGFYDISVDVQNWLDKNGVQDGLLTVYIGHTSASLLIQGNDDPKLAQDLSDVLDALAPRKDSYRHNNEGPDDVPSHIKSMLTETQLSIPVTRGKMALGKFQGIFVLEHRDGKHMRKVTMHFIGVLG